jgi:hypothetical protein
MEQPVTFGMTINVIDLFEEIDVEDCHCVFGFERLEQHLTQTTIANTREHVGDDVSAEFAEQALS